MTQLDQSQSNSTLTPATLSMTSELLRHDNPSLAGAVQDALSELREPLPGRAGADGPAPANTALVSRLEARTVGHILSALTDLGHRAMTDPGFRPEDLERLQGLLNDWASLADWILNHAKPLPGRPSWPSQPGFCKPH